MPAALGVGAAAADVALILLAITIAAMGVWLLEFGKGQVQGLPLVGTQLANALNSVEGGLFNAAKQVIQALVNVLAWAEHLILVGIQAVAGGLIGVLSSVVSSLGLALAAVETRVAAAEQRLAAIPGEIANDVPQVFKDLFPQVPDPIPKLGRLIGLLPALVILAEQLLDWLLQVPHAIADLHDLQQLVYRHSQELVILEGDLQQERMARLAAEQQLQIAQQAATAAQDARQAQDRSQWSPLLPLTVLAVLSGTLIDVLKKTAQCDPCKRLDDNLPGLAERIEALEAFGE